MSDRSELEKWISAALEVADSEGMADDTVIPTWPKDVAETGRYPALTVGALREWQTARAQGDKAVGAICSRCNGQGVDPDPEPACCGHGTVHGCCGEPEPYFGPCRDCYGAGLHAHPAPSQAVRSGGAGEAD